MKKTFIYLLIVISAVAVFSLEGCRMQIPDGSRIAFASSRDGNLEIYVMDPAGKSQVRLTNNNSGD